jgi:hypothetical protein
VGGPQPHGDEPIGRDGFGRFARLARIGFVGRRIVSSRSPLFRGPSKPSRKKARRQIRQAFPRECRMFFS